MTITSTYQAVASHLTSGYQHANQLAHQAFAHLPAPMRAPATRFFDTAAPFMTAAFFPQAVLALPIAAAIFRPDLPWRLAQQLGVQLDRMYRQVASDEPSTYATYSGSYGRGQYCPTYGAYGYYDSSLPSMNPTFWNQMTPLELWRFLLGSQAVALFGLFGATALGIGLCTPALLMDAASRAENLVNDIQHSAPILSITGALNAFQDTVGNGIESASQWVSSIIP